MNKDHSAKKKPSVAPSKQQPTSPTDYQYPVEPEGVFIPGMQPDPDAKSPWSAFIKTPKT